MSSTIIGIYLVAVLLLAWRLAVRADHRPLVFIFLVWLMGYPVLVQEEIMPHIGALNFDLQPTRIVLLILLPALVVNRLAPEAVRKRSFAPLAPFEKILIAYVLISTLSILVNYESLGIKQAISSVEKQLAFGVFYFSARDYLTREDYRIIERGIILLAVFSALVAIAQYVYDPHFFRVGGTYRGAFANVGRSTGAFQEEYDHAIYLTFAIVVVGLWKNGRPLWQWLLLSALFGLSVIFTFQRMPWAGFFLAIVGVLVIRNWKNRAWRNFGVVMTGLVFVFVYWLPWTDVLTNSLPQDFVTGRLMDDTLTERLTINEFAIGLVPKYPLGLGETVVSPIYYQEYYNSDLPLEAKSVGLTIHNGFLSATVRFGIAGGIAFACMLFGFLLFTARRATPSNWETFIVPSIVAILILYNMTEDFSAIGGQPLLLAGWLMGCFVGQNLYHSSNPTGDSSKSVSSH